MRPDPSHELLEPDDRAVLSGIPRENLTTELLGLCEEFFLHASPTVHAELRQFLIARGCHPHTSLGWFLDNLGFATLCAADNAVGRGPRSQAHHPRPARSRLPG